MAREAAFFTAFHIYALEPWTANCPARSSHGFNAVSVLHLSQELQHKLGAGPLVVSQLAAELAAFWHGSDKPSRSLHACSLTLQQTLPMFPHSLRLSEHLPSVARSKAPCLQLCFSEKLSTSSGVGSSYCDNIDSECSHAYSCQEIYHNRAILIFVQRSYSRQTTASYSLVIQTSLVIC